MGYQVKVGPRVIQLNQGNTVMVSGNDGQISSNGHFGLFCEDTRFLSNYQFTVNLKPFILITASPINHYTGLFYLTNPSITSPEGEIPEQTVLLQVTRMVGGGVHDDFDLISYASRPVHLYFEITVESDFLDIFDVKTDRLIRRGTINTLWDQKGQALNFTYENKDFKRKFLYQLGRADETPFFANGRISFPIILAPGGCWHTCANLIPVTDRERRPAYSCLDVGVGNTEMDQMQRRWLEEATELASPNDVVTHAFTRAVEDLGSLRLYEDDPAEEIWLPAAGVPWFLTLFGRDSLIAAYQTLPIHYPFGLGVLKKLGNYQADGQDDYRDMEPGKILHEIRFGELAHFKVVPQTPYFGTHDATLLYIILLSETFRWMGARSFLEEHRSRLERCLAWVDRFGDRDGDGFQEYATRSPVGYRNQGWKDAGDAVVYPDGRIVEPPIALCELQGYAYDAKRRAAEIFEILGDEGRANTLRNEAEALRERFNDVFWMEEEGFYAYGLDSSKQPVRTIASNPGHLLWSGIVPERRAARVVSRLMAEDLYSGWGIRTLSSKNPAYNPLSYQCGSVWPHDNAIIAAGFKRYGFAEAAQRVAKGIFDAANCFERDRLPELFSGIERRPYSFPVEYLGANIPQAWAAGSVFMLLNTLLGLEPDAERGVLRISPSLPEWLPEVTLSGMKVGRSRLTVRFRREGSRTRYEVKAVEGKPIQVEAV